MTLPIPPPRTRTRSRIRGTEPAKPSGRFQSGERHPHAVDLAARLEALRKLSLGTLTLTGTILRDGKRQTVTAICAECRTEKPYDVHNLLGGKTKGCVCQRGLKYRHPAAVSLSDRFHAAIDRCNNPRNPAFNNYGAIGIEVRFSGPEDWVNYILGLEPHDDYSDLEIDRRDNSGHYERGNLRLVSKSENLRNKSNNKFVVYKDERLVAADLYAALKADYPDFDLSPWTTAKLAARGVSIDEILSTKPRKKRR